MLTVEPWASGKTYTTNSRTLYENEIYICTVSHTSGQTILGSLGSFKTDILIGKYWDKMTRTLPRIWSTRRIYVEGERILYGFIEFFCQVRHESGVTFRDDIELSQDGMTYWRHEAKRIKQVPEWMAETPLFGDYIDVVDSTLMQKVDIPTVQLANLRELGAETDPEILKLTAQMLGFDFSKFLGSGSGNTEFLKYLTSLVQYRKESGLSGFMNFVSFVLQFITGKPWVLEQLYTKNYSVFLRPEQIPENTLSGMIITPTPNVISVTFVDGYIGTGVVPQNVGGSVGKNTVDVNAPFLYMNMPDTAWRCVYLNQGQPPDGTVPRIWTEYTTNTRHANVRIAVDGLTIVDPSGDSVENYFNIGVLGGEMIFTGETDSWIKLRPDQFNGVNDFTIKTAFKIRNINAISCIFHIGNNMATGANNEFLLAVNADGSMIVHMQSIAYTIFPAGTVELDTRYDFILSRSSGRVTCNIQDQVHNKIYGEQFICDTPFIATSAVLGQEQDSDYGGFDSLQAFNGILYFFSFEKPPFSTNVRGLWDLGTTYKENDVVVFSAIPSYYATSRYELTNAPDENGSIDNKGGIDVGQTVRNIFYEFAPATMVLQFNKPDYDMLIDGFPLLLNLEPEISEIDEAIPIEYLCPQVDPSADPFAARLIVPFK